jgi:hypothetical protein
MPENEGLSQSMAWQPIGNRFNESGRPAGDDFRIARFGANQPKSKAHFAYPVIPMISLG